jgi:hypothetical protein
MKGLLYDREREVEEMRKETEILVSERNNFDEQYSHVLRKMKRLEKENSDMRVSYQLVPPLILSLSPTLSISILLFSPFFLIPLPSH